MEIQIYSCAATFPILIEKILRERGYIVEPIPEIHSRTSKIHGAFSFRIKKGKGELKVIGNEEDDIYIFHIIGNHEGDPISMNIAEDMLDRVEKIMLTNGADLYEIIEL